MKVFILFLLTLFFAPIYSINIENYVYIINIAANQLSINQDFQDNLVYKYGVFKIIKERYLYNLRSNVQSYLSHQDWNYYCKDEFKKAFIKYMDALEKNRLYTDDFGTIIDSEGKLGNVDDYDYWYDNKGNRITGTEYRTLSVRKQKKYWTFYANREVATYFDIVAKAIVNKK